MMRVMRENEPMINFTVGPVMSGEEVLAIGGEQTPYFRTQEFSNIMLESERLMKEFTNAGDDGRAAFMTGSGTASMEAVVVNFFDKRDKILVINGGGFGHRFVELCELYGYEFTDIPLEPGKTLTKEALYEYDGKGYTGLLVNIHETSTGVHYSLNMLGEFCKRNGMFFVVDAISSFLADEIDMKKNHVNVMITGSQKALACPPGISIIVMDRTAVDRLDDYPVRCMYLDLRDALKNGERGQTPFTPAVTILLQINARLREIKANGGPATEIARIKDLAEYFREQVLKLPFEIFSEEMSNAVTPLRTLTASANDIFLHLKDEYGIWVCPNGGALKDIVFRVGHIGHLSKKDYDDLLAALKDLQMRGII